MPVFYKKNSKLINQIKIYFIKLISINYILFIILLFAFIHRTINLNYNSPFSDEAVYIIVGKLGVFQNDWWSYNARAWMGGSPYFYPTLAAISYVTGGIVGTRMINVILGVLSINLIFLITLKISSTSTKENFLAALISSIVMAFSATSYYVSRLATYDMPSYFSMLLSFYLVINAQEKKSNSGKFYFLASMFMLISILMKIITAMYLPLILVFSYYNARRLSLKKKPKLNKLHFCKIYFLIPIISGLMIYLISNFGSLLDFAKVQEGREMVNYSEVMSSFKNYLFPTLTLYLISFLGFLDRKMIKKFFVLSFLAIIPLIFHLMTHRRFSFDKHVYMSLCFLAVIIGIGLSNIFKTSKLDSRIKAVSLLLGLIIFSLYSYKVSQSYNSIWVNTYEVEEFINKSINENSLVLAENGPEIILSTYNINFPTHTSTFDYLKYGNSEDLVAYENAVNDGYFNIIELAKEDHDISERYIKINERIRGGLDSNYKLAYEDNDFKVFKRGF